ncbi:MAG: HlyD family efflux transporter periplasmic adaptor subunit [Acidimicrobiia bacterium]|nr:HlyD family efflux transporter periplasmic adaptor subunit [Acidimicrobiia bacterium]
MTGDRQLPRRAVAVAVVLAVAGAAAGTWAALRSGSPKPVGIVERSSSETTITEKTITSQRLVDGTLGFAGATSVLQPVGTDPDAVSQADLKAWSAAQTLTQATSEVSAAVQGYTAARAAAEDAHSSALAFGPTSMYTALPAVGQVITRGQPLFSVSTRSVPLLYGSVTPWRAFRAGMSAGSDVAELNQNLADLGYGSGLAGSVTFTSATVTAVAALQRALGLPMTGELRLGSVVFEPGPVRIAAVPPKLGAPVQPGSPALDITSTTRQITVKLDAASQSEVKAGDPVTITLPDNRTTSGTVTAVGTVATRPASTGPDSNAPPTVDVVITPTDAAVTGNLDAAPVQVSIVTASADHALAVPVTALLALGGGGYGLDVIATDGARHVESVTLGLFDDAEGLVQVSGPNVHAGEKVAVANS